jgi:hypothetical protein
VRARPRTVIVSLLALVLLGLVLVGIFLFHNAEYITSLLLQHVERQLGRHIEVGQARLVLLPRIRLKLSQVVVRDVDPTQVVFSADRVELVLRAVPLLQQQVVGKRLTIEQPKLMIRRNTAGQWNLVGAPAGDSMGNPLSLMLMVKETVVRAGEVTVIDEYRPDGTRQMKLSALDASVVVAPQGTRADIGISGIIQAPRGVVSAISLVGTISQTPSLIPPPSGSAAGPFVQFDGMAEVLNVDIKQMVDFFGPRPIPARMQGAANLRGHIRLVPGVAGYDMVLSDMSANIEGIRITGHASLSGLLATQPTFSLTFASSPILLEDLLNRFPLESMNPDILKVIEERQIGGRVEVLNATLTGSATPEAQFSLIGEILISEGRALLGADRVPAQDLSGTVFLEPGRLRLTELSGRYGTLQISGGKGLITFLEKGPALELEVTGDMTASHLMEVLARKLHSEPAASTLSSLREIKGHVVLTLRLAGALAGQDGVEVLGGEFDVQEVSFQLGKLPEPVAGLTGRVLVSRQSVEVDKVSGRLGKTKMELNGVLALGEKAQFQNFTVHAKFSIEQWVQLLAPPGPQESVFPFAGSTEATVDLSGPVDQPRMKASVNLQESSMNVPGWIEKAAGIPGALTLEGTLGPAALLNVERLELVVAPFRLSGKGKIKLGSSVAFEGTLVSGPLRLNELPAGFSLFGLKDGSLEISLDVRASGSDVRSWRVTGWLALTDAVLRVQGQEDLIDNLYVRLKLIRNGADLKRLALRFKGNELRVSGTIRNWHRVPSIDLKFESALFDLDLLVPKGARSPARELLERVAASTRSVATVAIDRAVYRQFKLTDLSCRINVRDGVLDVDRIVAQSEGGSIAGRLIVRLPERGPAESEAALRITGVPFEEFTHLFGAEEHLIVGTMNLTGTLQASGKNPKGVLPALNGTVDLLIQQGRILKLSVLSKIVTILNLPVLLQGKVNLAKDGMPFDKITASFSMHDGMVTSENLVVDSPVMKMTGAGRYDPAADRLEFVVAVSPFGSYAQLLKSIPLFGKLFAGERKGIDTALFEVKGPLKDPQVNYLSLRSFATGLTGLAQLAFDVLKNAIMLPKELIAPEAEPNHTDKPVGPPALSPEFPEPSAESVSPPLEQLPDASVVPQGPADESMTPESLPATP